MRKISDALPAREAIVKLAEGGVTAVRCRLTTQGLRGIMANVLEPWHRCKEQYGGDMRNIVNEAGEIVAKATRDGTLVGGHHRIAMEVSLGQKLFWEDTGGPVNPGGFFRHPVSSLRHTA
jgi:hypothetical protein